ncbi:MAG TPA: signal peptidase II [Casimicrobiaceae bacterium]|nr:signal peptidase II [Casimicrobiaceae bacterium]
MTSAAAAGTTTGARWYAWLLVSVAVIALDQASKAAMLKAFSPGEYKAITSFFTLVLSFNTGAAFSFLAGQGGWQRWLFTAIALGATLLIVGLLRRGRDAWYCAGLAFILGGALGNLWDRLQMGAVVDFLLFHWRGWFFPAFNVADSSITVGAALLILDSFRHRRAPVTVARDDATQPGGS